MKNNLTSEEPSVASQSISTHIYDIGELLQNHDQIREMSEEKRYEILKNHSMPDSAYEFRKEMSYGCMRSCKLDNLRESFVYSPHTNRVYCLHCALFGPLPLSNAFVSGFSKWQQITGRQSLHISYDYHNKTMEKAQPIMDRIEEPRKATIPNLLDASRQQRIEKYPKLLHAIARVVHLLGRQGIAFRGKREELNNELTTKNTGNFIAILKEVAHHYPDLQEHISNPLRKKATYLSPYSQNEMIEVIGNKIIKSDIIDEIKQARFHTVSLDEVTYSNEQLISVCFRYVDKRITGEHIGTALLEFYKRTGINIKQCVGQCYDGASNMQPERVGAASYVLNGSPQAVVTHCCMHNLNLTLASSCNFLLAQNIFEQYKNITLFFN